MRQCDPQEGRMIEDPAPAPLESPDSLPSDSATAAAHEEAGEIPRSFGDQSSTANGMVDANDQASRPARKSYDDEPLPLLDKISALIATPDTSAFFGGLIGVLSSRITDTVSCDTSVEPLLRLLGHALAEGLDEELAFQEIVDAVERKDRTPDAITIAAAFLARIASGPVPATTPLSATELTGAAVQVVREAHDSGGTRSWRLLPQFAAKIAERGLPPTTLATALPRLWHQFVSGPRNTYSSAMDQPRSTQTGRPQQMILNGAVEIVILGR
jgi:hypothetical protein